MLLVIGILSALVIIQEIRIHRLTDRLLLQASVPSLDPVRVAAPTEREQVERIAKTRRKLFSAKIPG